MIQVSQVHCPWHPPALPFDLLFHWWPADVQRTTLSLHPSLLHHPHPQCCSFALLLMFVLGKHRLLPKQIKGATTETEKKTEKKSSSQAPSSGKQTSQGRPKVPFSVLFWANASLCMDSNSLPSCLNLKNICTTGPDNQENWKKSLLTS